MGRLIDLTGQRFGRLLVLERAQNIRAHAAWLCQCDCGNTKIVSSYQLRSGETISCGCYRKEKTGRQFRKYPQAKVNPRIYRIWKLMRCRCYGETSPKYKNYGARGIQICPEWLNDFLAFQTWALESGYSDDLSIDRIDVNGPYSPENCRWTNNIVQCNNKTDNAIYEYQGESHTVADWARIKGIRVHTLYTRLRLGWSIEKALESPVETKFRGK